MLSPEAVVGWLAAASSAAWGLPQCLRILRVRSADGVSARAWQATLWSGIAWASYGVRTDRPQVIWCNVLMTAETVLILALLVRHTGNRVGNLWLPPMVGATSSVFAWTALGEAAFTAAMAVPLLGSQYLQLHLAATARETGALSVAALAVGSSSQALWVIYGTLTGSLSIVVLNLVGTSLMATTILVTKQRRRVVGR